VDNAQTLVDALQAQLATQRSNVDVVARAVSVAERNLDDTIVRAPFTGIVTVRRPSRAKWFHPSPPAALHRTGIGTIVDMDSLEIRSTSMEFHQSRAACPAGQRQTQCLSDWRFRHMSSR
jgi:hypothetical protein